MRDTRAAAIETLQLEALAEGRILDDISAGVMLDGEGGDL